jgi:hypothetical protein
MRGTGGRDMIEILGVTKERLVLLDKQIPDQLSWRQAIDMARSMNWTVEEKMVYAAFAATSLMRGE